jgi:hypothetical protein
MLLGITLADRMAKSDFVFCSALVYRIAKLGYIFSRIYFSCC